jgi:ABC-type uncharacterized transport system fused permease/ATPase subunit
MNQINILTLLKKYLRKLFTMPWITIFGPVFLLSFFTLFIYFRTIALDKNIGIINKDKLITFDLNEVWKFVFVLTIVNYTANFFLEKSNPRYKYIFLLELISCYNIQFAYYH